MDKREETILKFAYAISLLTEPEREAAISTLHKANVNGFAPFVAKPKKANAPFVIFWNPCN